MQWVGYEHPDPLGTQFSVMRAAIRKGFSKSAMES
jgi:hypothetical protein